MSVEEQQKLEEAVTDLVIQILQRGRLNQQELDGKIGVRDMGINTAKLRYVNQIMLLAKTEAIDLADKIIGKEQSAEMKYADPMDEDMTPDAGDIAIIAFQRQQRLALADYQLGEKPQYKIEPVMHMQDSTITMTRVDPTKVKGELVGVTGRDQFSENEE